jgi:nucleoside-diphosphate-sugar epimerase
MRVAVTGHDGYIGTVLVPMLVEAGHQVWGLDTYWYEGCGFGEQGPQPQAARVDLREVTPDLLAEADAVVHLAAISNDPVGDLHRETTYDVNHRASARLAEAAKAAGVHRFVFASSCSLYGKAASDEALDETADFNPVTPYGESKVFVERDLLPMADEQFCPVFLRNATVYGLSPRLRLDLVVNNLVAHAFTSGEVLVMSDGTPWRPLVHVQDVCRTVLAVLDAPADQVRGEAFNVGRDEENYQVSQVAEIVAETVPGSRVVYAEGGGPDERSYRVDFSKLARTFPDLALTRSVPEGAAELLEAFRSTGFTAADLAGSRYIRLRRIRELLEAGRLDDALRWVRED